MSTHRLAASEALAGPMRWHRLDRREPADVCRVADELVGLHATDAATPVLSLRARVAGFERSDLEVAMWESWDLVRFRAMRLTMFVFPHELLRIAAVASMEAKEAMAQRWLNDAAMTAQQYASLANAVEEALQAGPLTSRALRRALGVPAEVQLPGVVSRMCDEGRIVGGAPPRSWRSNVREYHLWEAVLPGLDWRGWEPAVATAELVRRYINSYGPVSLTDIAWWTGLTKRKCREALESLGDAVHHVEVDGWPGPLWATATLSEAGADPTTNVVALPLLDPYVQGYKDRERFLDADRHRYVYDGGGNSAATIVRAGRIIGVWQPSSDPVESIRYHLFDRQSAGVRSAAESDLAAAGATYFDHEVEVVAVPSMLPLDEGGGRSAMHPLDEVVHRAARRTQRGQPANG